MMQLPPIDPKEVSRYLGYRGNQPDPEVQARIDEGIAAVRAAAVPRTTHEIFPLSIREDGAICAASLELHSRSLLRNLSGCREVILFAATLGVGVDSLIRRGSLMDMTRGVILQAAAAAAIEAVCDEEQERLRAEAAERGLYMRPRFSPGYGDLPLSVQKEFTALLQTPKRIGLTLTDSGIMVPVKSVTALIGLSTTATPCHHQGCEVCAQKDCPFRRI